MGKSKRALQINKLLYDRWRILLLSSALSSVLAIIPATIDYQYSFSPDRDPQNCDYYSVFHSFWRYISLILSLIAIILLIPYRIYYLYWQKQLIQTYAQLPALGEITFMQIIRKTRKSTFIKFFDWQTIIYCLIYMIFPYPGIQGQTFQVTQDMIVDTYICYQFSELFYSIMVSRILILMRVCFNFGKYKSLVAIRHCQQHNFEANTKFSIKCYLKDYPLGTLIVLFIIPWFIMFAIQLRVMERPIIIDGSRSHLHSIMNSAWLVIVTMTTVGYGDIFPVTVLGRTVATMATIWAGVVLSLMFVGICNLLELTNKEGKAHQSILLSRAAANAIMKGMLYYQTRNENLKNRYQSMKRLVKAVDQFRIVRELFQDNVYKDLEDRQNQMEREIYRIRQSLGSLHEVIDDIYSHIPRR